MLFILQNSLILSLQSSSFVYLFELEVFLLAISLNGMASVNEFK